MSSNRPVSQHVVGLLVVVAESCAGRRRIASVVRRVPAVAGMWAVLLMSLWASSAAIGEITVAGARDPVSVELRVGSIKHALDYSSSRSKTVRARMARQVSATCAAHPDRLVVLRFKDLPLRYEGLSGSSRKAVKRAAGEKTSESRSKLADWYERRAARFVGDVVRRAKDGGGLISVAGLPFEDGKGRKGWLDAGRLNRRYAGVIRQLDAFVASRSFILADNASNVSTVRTGLPRAAALSESRPIFFRANGRWWRLTESADRSADAGNDAAEKPSGDTEAASAGATKPRDDQSAPSVSAENGEQRLRGSVQARWVDPPDEYVLGSSVDVLLRVRGSSKDGVNVVFQVWSQASASIEAPYADSSVPFKYPGAALDTVAPGAGELQAVVRDGSNRVVQVVRHHVVFLAAMPTERKSAWDGEIAENDQGTQAFDELTVNSDQEEQETTEVKQHRALIYQRTLSDTVRQYAESLGAERCINIPSWYGDREKVGTINLDQLDEGLAERIPPDYEGYATLDFEKPYRKWLREGPGSLAFEQAQAEMLKALRYAKEHRPLTKWAFWGEPSMKNYVKHGPSGQEKLYHKHTPEAREWLLDLACAPAYLAEQDWYCPSAYDEFYGDETSSGSLCQVMVTTDLIMRCRELGQDEKPVIACVWNRAHDKTYSLLSKEEWTRDQIQLSLSAGADGIAWWSNGYRYWSRFRERSLEEHTSPEVETMTEEEALAYWDTMLREYSEFLVSQVAEYGQE